MARVTSDGLTRPSLTSVLRDIRQTGRDIMSVIVSQEADMLLANLANGHDTTQLNDLSLLIKIVEVNLLLDHHCTLNLCPAVRSIEFQ